MFRTRILPALLGLSFPLSAHAIDLLQPLVPGQQFPGGNMPIITYFEAAMPYIYSVAIGFCLIWIVKSGSDIILAGNDSKAAKAKERLMEVAMAILVLTFGGFILRKLNDLFFT